MDDIWIISWFNHTAFDANPIWKSPILSLCGALPMGPGPVDGHDLWRPRCGPTCATGPTFERGPTVETNLTFATGPNLVTSPKPG